MYSAANVSGFAVRVLFGKGRRTQPVDVLPLAAAHDLAVFY